MTNKIKNKIKNLFGKEVIEITIEQTINKTSGKKSLVIYEKNRDDDLTTKFYHDFIKSNCSLDLVFIDNYQGGLLRFFSNTMTHQPEFTKNQLNKIVDSKGKFDYIVEVKQ